MITVEHFYEELYGFFNFPTVYKLAVSRIPDNMNGHFVEVGSFAGKSSAFMAVEIINSGKNIKFDCVDTWEGSDEHNTLQFPEAYRLTKNNLLYDTFISNMKPVESNYTPVKMCSVDAAKLYEDGSLDFVFIDASHDYENVKNDIIAWFPKVKLGGIMGGHDYDNMFLGVVQAVNELFGENITIIDGNSWIVEKL